jgi:acetyltransferase-like isoleucine patch superfamily enzyme
MYYSNKELIDLGCKKIGKNCKISNKTFIYSNNLEMGDNVRIDDLVTLKGKIVLKNNIHLAKGCTLSGGTKGIFIDNFTAISNFVQFFTLSDDYIAPYITSTTFNKIAIKNYSKIYNKSICIGKNVLIGSMSVLLPGTIIGDYSSIGAFSVIHEKIEQGLYYSNHNKIVKKKEILL